MSTFHQVLGLWLAPDFSAVQRGELPPPHVDFDAVDADSLAGAIAAFNGCGENVTVRVPNDAIDQVTVHYRMTGRMPGSAKCDDTQTNYFAMRKPLAIWTCGVLGRPSTRSQTGGKLRRPCCSCS